MLLIQLKVGEAVEVADNIKVTLVKNSRLQSATIGFDAPQDVRIQRQRKPKLPCTLLNCVSPECDRPHLCRDCGGSLDDDQCVCGKEIA